MIKEQLKPAFVLLMAMTILLGGIYPLAITAMAQIAFPAEANGSLVLHDGSFVGSKLIGQANHDATYFWPRPSATNYGTLPSSGSNFGLTNAQLRSLVSEREANLRREYHLPDSFSLPADLVFASASGLDPHISPEAARLQISRVARTRGLPESKVAQAVENAIEPPQWRIFGEPRVNVLLLNLALDQLK